MVLERQAVQEGPCSRLIWAIVPQVGVVEETLRMWCNRYGHEVGPMPVVEGLQEQNKCLKRELAQARRAIEIPRAASAVCQGTRPPYDEMIRFIGQHRDRFRVEAVCRALCATECGFITFRDYRAAKYCPASTRAVREGGPAAQDRADPRGELQRLRGGENTPRQAPCQLADQS